MKKIVTETLWVSFMGLLALAMITAWNTVSEARPHPIDYIQQINVDPIPSVELEPQEFYRAPKIKVSKKDFDCLAKNIYYEAGVEDYTGKIAVAQVTWNRVQHGRWGKTVCQVVYAKKQFSWTHQNKPKPKGELWQASRKAAQDFVNGIRHYALKGSKYYHATWIKAPAWTDPMTELATIGQHTFYRYHK
jgi:N-acetylmuramoyl-L-alanine amidase